MFWTLVLPYLARYLLPVAIVVVGIGIAILRWSFLRRSWFGMIAGGLIGVAGSLVGFVAVLFGGVTMYAQLTARDPTPEEEFHRAFSVRPGAEVTQIRSWVTVSTTNDRQCLQFVAPPRTVAMLTRGRFERSSVDDCRRRAVASKRDAPAWWTPAAAPRGECYVAEPFLQSPDNAAWLLYDPATGQAYFHYLAVYEIP